ncbi:hypothetical protein DU506_19580 [Vreelandella rituensis]|uniref:Uncharacterized protein n=1 Tax=Vreelandella rituensis TaxID=2282306 RepID=A0A368TNU3_9GAMM|nr:hypothetical protein DU506_19580 [Halomonas rituensis]
MRLEDRFCPSIPLVFTSSGRGSLLLAADLRQVMAQPPSILAILAFFYCERCERCERLVGRDGRQLDACQVGVLLAGDNSQHFGCITGVDRLCQLTDAIVFPVFAALTGGRSIGVTELFTRKTNLDTV